jgi:hypothetical protein
MIRFGLAIAIFLGFDGVGFRRKKGSDPFISKGANALRWRVRQTPGGDQDLASGPVHEAWAVPVEEAHVTLQVIRHGFEIEQWIGSQDTPKCAGSQRKQALRNGQLFFTFNRKAVPGVITCESVVCHYRYSSLSVMVPIIVEDTDSFWQ